MKEEKSSATFFELLLGGGKLSFACLSFFAFKKMLYQW